MIPTLNQRCTYVHPQIHKIYRGRYAGPSRVAGLCYMRLDDGSQIFAMLKYMTFENLRF